MYSETRAAQMAAFMLMLHGGNMPLEKLNKLMYLAEMKAMARYGESITGDVFVTFTQTFCQFETSARSPLEKGWKYYVKEEPNHEVGLARVLNDDDFSDLSLAETDIIANTLSEFGTTERWQLLNRIHPRCCDKGSATSENPTAILPYDIFIALTSDAVQATKLTDRYNEFLKLSEQKQKIL